MLALVRETNGDDGLNVWGALDDVRHALGYPVSGDYCDALDVDPKAVAKQFCDYAERIKGDADEG